MGALTFLRLPCAIVNKIHMCMCNKNTNITPFFCMHALRHIHNKKLLFSPSAIFAEAHNTRFSSCVSSLLLLLLLLLYYTAVLVWWSLLLLFRTPFLSIYVCVFGSSNLFTSLFSKMENVLLHIYPFHSSPL